MSNLPQTPPASTTVADVARFEHNLQVSAPYFAGMKPSGYEANRAMVRRMAAYLAGLQVLARGPQMRAAASLHRLPNHLNRAVEALSHSQWDEARTALARAEAETERIVRTVGH